MHHFVGPDRNEAHRLMNLCGGDGRRSSTSNTGIICSLTQQMDSCGPWRIVLLETRSSPPITEQTGDGDSDRALTTTDAVGR